LNDLSLEARERHGIDIKKQSLHDRFNEYAPVFLKAALEKLLQKQVLKHVNVMTYCKPSKIRPMEACYRKIFIPKLWRSNKPDNFLSGITDET
jgi:hypothetical protein